jgi:hypothetical protein
VQGDGNACVTQRAFRRHASSLSSKMLSTH